MYILQGLTYVLDVCKEPLLQALELLDVWFALKDHSVVLLLAAATQ